MFEEMAVHGVPFSCRFSAACFPQREGTDSGATEHPGPTVGRLMARESLDLLHAMAVPHGITIVIRGDEGTSCITADEFTNPLVFR
jgi:hypothetical protein